MPPKPHTPPRLNLVETPTAAKSAPTSAPNSTLDRADLELVAAIRAGKPNAWTELLRRHQDQLYTICFRMLNNREAARDAAQDTLVKVVQNLPHFDGRSQLSTWMIRIAMNTCLSALRARRLRKHERLGPETESAARHLGTRSSENDREPQGESSVQGNEDRARLLAALAKLDDEQRAILMLRDGRGMDYDQIGQVLDLAIGTVKSRIFRARSALRAVIEEQGNLGQPPHPGQHGQRDQNEPQPPHPHSPPADLTR